MKKEIKIPDIAENVDSGVIGRILVSKGDKVKKDQPVVEVETDKAATDIPSPFDGTVEEIRVEEGDEVEVGQVIMIVEAVGEEAADEEDGLAAQASEGDEQKEKDSGEDQETGAKEDSAEDEDTDEDEGSDEEKDSEESDDSEKDDDSEEDEDSEKEKVSGEEEESGDEKKKSAKGDDTRGSEGRDDEEDEAEAEKDAEASGAKAEKDKGRSGTKTVAEDIPAAPFVRRMAREAGIDLADVQGTGPGTRITAEDIESAKQEKESGGKGDQQKKSTGEKTSARGKESKDDSGLPDFSQWGETKKEKLNTVRRITARTMTESWQQIPQVTQFDEADITDIEAFRQQHKEAYEKQGGKLTVTAILLKIAAFALQKFPRFNSSLDTSDNTLVMKQYINIGLAVDTDKGLIVPVIKDTDKKSLAEIARETVTLSKKARENEISPDELQGGNFTISNLGGIGGTGFTPIVYAPQVAILGVSKASYKQVFREERFQQRLVLPLTLTYDHRVIDGADGARFLRWICDVLEDPYALLT